MKIKIYSKITTIYRLQRAKSMEHGAWGEEHRAKSKGQIRTADISGAGVNKIS